MPLSPYSVGALSWFDDVMAKAVQGAPEWLSVSLSYYVTDEAAAVDDNASMSAKSEANAVADGLVSHHAGRPNIANIVKEFCAQSGTVAITSTSLSLLPRKVMWHQRLTRDDPVL